MQKPAWWRQTIPAKQEPIRVLVADDQPHILEAVDLLLSPQGIAVDCVRSPQLLLEALGERDYDVLLIDLNYTRDTTSGQEGLDLLARIQEFDARLPVIVMTAWGNIGLAVESSSAGRAILCRSPGRTSGCFRWCACMPSCARRCAERGNWNLKTDCCAPKECRSLLPARPRCSRCWN
jgi:CheY-like chemotaxis protein